MHILLVEKIRYIFIGSRRTSQTMFFLQVLCAQLFSLFGCCFDWWGVQLFVEITEFVVVSTLETLCSSSKFSTKIDHTSVWFYELFE